MEEVVSDACVNKDPDRNDEEVGQLNVDMHQNVTEGYGCVLALLLMMLPAALQLLSTLLTLAIAIMLLWKTL